MQTTIGELNKTNIGAFFESPEPVPPGGAARAAEIIAGGRMFRYLAHGPEDSEVALLERDFAELIGAKYALGLNSCSSAILLALRTLGAKHGTKILVPAFTFTAVPSAIVNLGAVPVVVESNADYRIDINDLRRKINGDTKLLLLSHMRGQISDLDSILEICEQHGIAIIEDAAHGLGSVWNGKPVGSFGKVACFSFQSNKIVNAGEGGMLTTNDPKLMSVAIIGSGAYEKLHERHFSNAELSESFHHYRKLVPLYNMRMTEYQAAIVRSQLAGIEEKAKVFRANYDYLVNRLEESGRVQLPAQNPRELRAPDSIQFRLTGFNEPQMIRFMQLVRDTGLPLSAIGVDKDNARVPWNWHYVGATPECPETRRHLLGACDIRLPSTLQEEHLDYLADSVLAAIGKVEHETEGAAGAA
jgi:perosamine synthetase